MVVEKDAIFQRLVTRMHKCLLLNAFGSRHQLAPGCMMACKPHVPGMHRLDCVCLLSTCKDQDDHAFGH